MCVRDVGWCCVTDTLQCEQGWCCSTVPTLRDFTLSTLKHTDLSAWGQIVLSKFRNTSVNANKKYICPHRNFFFVSLIKKNLFHVYNETVWNFEIVFNKPLDKLSIVFRIVLYVHLRLTLLKIKDSDVIFIISC